MIQLVYKFEYPLERHKKKKGKHLPPKNVSFRIHFIHVSCLLDSLAAFLRPRFLQFSDVDRDFSRTDATAEHRSIHACHCLDKILYMVVGRSLSIHAKLEKLDGDEEADGTGRDGPVTILGVRRRNDRTTVESQGETDFRESRINVNI